MNLTDFSLIIIFVLSILAMVTFFQLLITYDQIFGDEFKEQVKKHSIQHVKTKLNKL